MMLLFAIGLSSTWLGPMALAGPPVPAPLVLARADDPASEFAALQKQYEDAAKAFDEAYQKAKTDAEKKEAIDKSFPKGSDYAAKALAIAAKAKGQDVAEKALIWALSLGPDPASMDAAVDTLLSDHVESLAVGDACFNIYGPAAEKLCKALIEKSPHDAVKGKAMFRRAQLLQEKGDEAAEKEALDLYNEVVESYSGVKAPMGRLGEAARKAVFEIENLGIGKECPEIQGADVDGVAFALADYKGKVVMLDFWGFW